MRRRDCASRFVRWPLPGSRVIRCFGRQLTTNNDVEALFHGLCLLFFQSILLMILSFFLKNVFPHVPVDARGHAGNETRLWRMVKHFEILKQVGT